MDYSKLVFKIYSIVARIVFTCDRCVHYCCDDCNYNTNSCAKEIYDLIESEVKNGENEKNAECCKQDFISEECE